MAQEKQPLVNVGGKWIELAKSSEAGAFFEEGRGQLEVTDVLRESCFRRRSRCRWSVSRHMSNSGDSASFEKVDEPPNTNGATTI